jgi:hypothetical protein
MHCFRGRLLTVHDDFLYSSTGTTVIFICKIFEMRKVHSTYREPGVAGTRSWGTVEQDHSDDPVSVAHSKPAI